MTTQTTTISPYCNLELKKWGVSASQSKAMYMLHSIWKAEYLHPSGELHGREGDTQLLL